MKLLLLGILALIVVGFTAFSLFRPNSTLSFPGFKPKQETVEAQAIREAKKIYKEQKSKKIDFETSPCLSDNMGNGWALDIVHDPRLVVDDQVQCESYQNGQVQHIVEMTPDGKIFKAQ